MSQAGEVPRPPVEAAAAAAHLPGDAQEGSLGGAQRLEVRQGTEGLSSEWVDESRFTQSCT